MDVPSFEHYEPPVYTIHTEKAAMSSGVTNDSAIIGAAPVMLALFRQVNVLADLPTTILIRGETGTGKELFARALHYNSRTNPRLGKFVAVNCAGIPQGLLESLLFGHVRGAFTDAHYDKRGFVEEANGGTLFLDEIAEMTPYLQAKILRLLQEHEITRVGDTTTKKVNVRIIAATNHNLEEQMREGTFHSDLFYRINTFPLQLPSLQERSEDIPFLTQHFIKKYNDLYGERGVAIESVAESALQKLQEHPWLGNVRELENMVARAMILCGKGQLQEEDIVFNDRELAAKTIHTTPCQAFWSLSGAAAREHRWYDQGVLPMLFSDLRLQRYVHNNKRIKDIIDSHQVYTVNLGAGNRNTFAFVLTPTTLSLFFMAPDSEFYHSLEKKIHSGSFNKIVQEPFMVTSFARLKQKGFHYPNAALQTVVKRVQAYRLSEEFYAYFVLEEGHAPEIAYPLRGKNDESERKLEELRSEIHRHYQHFLNWKPGEPSWEVL